ncbi:MAG: hypothetical protein H0T44_15585 [Gemmatimonadales bacterium]|nr:hypothetical protein [Gemmatimonadales bacterium]
MKPPRVVPTAVPPPSAVPPCAGLGQQCRSLRATLRVGSLEEGDTSLDHEATWLLGHTQQLDFGELWEEDGELYLEAALRVPCRYLALDGGAARCRAHGFQGPAPRAPRPVDQPRRLGGDRFRVIDARKSVVRRLPVVAPALPARPLPVLTAANPCADARCRTSDNTRRAACCRDLQVEIMCTRDERMLESLVRSRRSPYLCKVERGGDYSIDVEMISACDYLASDGIACTLHGRTRADGRPAKPDLCSEWPPKNKGLHPGCVFAPGARRRKPAPV